MLNGRLIGHGPAGGRSSRRPVGGQLGRHAQAMRWHDRPLMATCTWPARGRLGDEPEAPRQPGEGVGEGLAPQVEVVPAGPDQDAGGDPGPEGGRLEGVGR